MKLLTINIHSHDDSFDAAVLNHHMKELAVFLHEEMVDLIALQEAAQEMDRPFAGSDLPMHCMIKDAAHTVRQGNAAYLLANHLQELNEEYYWIWNGFKLGYRKYEEGLAIFSRKPITDTDCFWISGIRDFQHFKSRKALTAKIRTGQGEALVCNVHMGRWDDPEESFKDQMKRLQDALTEKTQIYLMGDFNSPAGIYDEGWEMLNRLGWLDTYELAEVRDEGITVPDAIDGWRDGDHKGMRIDYIWLKQPENVKTSCVVCNGVSGTVISDHYGVLAEIQ